MGKQIIPPHRRPGGGRAWLAWTWAVVVLLMCLFGVASPASALDDYPYKNAPFDVTQSAAAMDPWAFVMRNCTSFAAWRLNVQQGRTVAPWLFVNNLRGAHFGDGSDWDDAARQLGFAVDQKPAVGSVAQWNGTPYGHVAIVSAVRSAGNTIDVESYNTTYRNAAGVLCYDGKYHTGTLTRGAKGWPSNFLHIADIPATPPAPSPPAPVVPKVGPATAMVIDVSGSMDESFQGARKIDKAKEAAKVLVQYVKGNGALNRADGTLSVTAFSSSARRQQDMTLDYAKVLSAIDQLQPQSSTNLAAGIEDGFAALAKTKTTYAKAMIILSDGLANEGVSNPDDIIAGPVTKAKNSGIKIFTIGFGDSGSIDESLLRRIATTTGGRYALADARLFKTDLSNLFIRAQVSSTAKVVKQFQGTVAQGKTVVMGTFSVPQGAGALQVVLNWLGSKLRLGLTDPAGQLVKPGYPGYRTSGTRPVQVKITNAKAGEWKASVYGQQVSQPNEPYFALAAIQTPPTPAPKPSATPTTSATPSVAPTPSPSVKPSAKPTKKPLPKPARTSSPVASSAALPSGGGGGGGMGGGGALLFLVLLAGAGLIVWLVVRSRPGAGPAAGALVLVGVDGREHALHAGPNSVGRDYGNDVLLDDSSVSRRHAVVEVSAAGVDLRDAGSTYGSKVNGLRVSAGRVGVGDELAFGAERLWLREAQSGWIQ